MTFRLLFAPALLSVSLVLLLTASTEAATGPNPFAAGGSPAQTATQSDISVLEVTIDAATTESVGGAFTVGATAVVQNDGPYGPADVAGSFEITAPPECHVYLGGLKQGSGSVEASSSAEIPLDQPWNVRCDELGTFSLEVSAWFYLTQQGAEDPNPDNNTGAGTHEIEVLLGACGDDPDPSGDPLQNLSPLLLTVIQDLTAEGQVVSEDQTTPLDCTFDLEIADPDGVADDECTFTADIPGACSLTFTTGIDEPGGSPESEPTGRLLPVSVLFIPPEFNIAPDTAIANATPTGEASFAIRTDLTLGGNGLTCVVDLGMSDTGIEGGVLPNVPDSDSSSDLTNPHVWPNDLNAERGLVEAAFAVNPLSPDPLILWSRMTMTFEVAAISIPFNVVIWQIDDPILQAATGAGWVAVGFPGDSVNPDPPGPGGTDPDADDPPPMDLLTCTPHSIQLTLDAVTPSGVYASCGGAGDHMGWALLDPDAVNYAGDEGPRSDTSSCVDDCPLINVGQPDGDSDGIVDECDSCPGTPNPDQDNTVHPATFEGDHCEDPDEDGVADASDNCPDHVNPGQENDVHPGTARGDHCEDPDEDGVADASDNCPDTANPGQENPDGDQWGDACDNCPNNANNGQENSVHPGTAQGDHCEDPDSDTVFDASDNCPDTANPGQGNADGDTWGDACDGCPTTVTQWSAPPGDDDCDAFATTDEQFITTDPNDACPNDTGEDAWPPDYNNDAAMDIFDVNILKPAFFSSAPGPPYSVRLDLSTDGAVDIFDVNILKPFFFLSCTP